MTEPQENEPVLAGLRAKVERYETELMRYMRDEAQWSCVKCGQGIAHGEWVSPRLLREQVLRDTDYRDGTEISIALMNLVRDGRLESNTRWEVRLP